MNRRLRYSTTDAGSKSIAALSGGGHGRRQNFEPAFRASPRRNLRPTGRPEEADDGTDAKKASAGAVNKALFPWLAQMAVASSVNAVATRSPDPGRVSKQRRESLHSPEDRDVVDFGTALEQQFLDVAVGQAVAQVQPDRDHDHARREPEPGER
ncbi:hypothetical protein GCM10010170_055120 [Dactylosporangium salmoneum]|uniref:Uncharacterized protein n=1 Tax=Dactylosporangium salmoneum TaxID=53361 RepID=A0ABP5TTR8_9ACTN